MGLGNPGADHAHTRHNVGFMVVDMLAERWQIALHASGDVRCGRGTIAGEAALLVQPQSFMNRSGEALEAVGGVAPGALVVVHDDLDLPPGDIRVRPRGGTGGHRGVASVMERYGADFARVRVGIGRPPEGHAVVDYVLESLGALELAPVRTSAVRASDAVECVLSEGTAIAMNRFNARTETEVNR
ncbi:MAG: aminoacyl-tRNA hydrolase [Candidatus Binatia bacterium]